MKSTLKILIGLSILILCLSMTAISAADNETPIESADDNAVSVASQEDNIVLEETADDNTLGSSDDTYTITAKDFKNNDRIKIDKNFKYTISKDDIDDAKNAKNFVIYKKFPNVKVKVYKPVKTTVKEKVYKTVKVKTTKKFTCWHLTKKTLKMDKKYFKNYYKYQSQGYKIDKGKWTKTGNTWKCVFTATKTKKVTKWTGKYKTRKVTKYKSETLNGLRMEIGADGVVSVWPDVKGYRNYVYQAGFAIPGWCTVGIGPYI